jgi:hypothetical protein
MLNANSLTFNIITRRYIYERYTLCTPRPLLYHLASSLPAASAHSPAAFLLENRPQSLTYTLFKPTLGCSIERGLILASHQVSPTSTSSPGFHISSSISFFITSSATFAASRVACIDTTTLYAQLGSVSRPLCQCATAQRFEQDNLSAAAFKVQLLFL